MDTRALHDHAWDADVPVTAGTVPQTAPTAAGGGSARPETDAHRGFRVLSLEQYAADHARSLHRSGEHHLSER